MDRTAYLEMVKNNAILAVEEGDLHKAATTMMSGLAASEYFDKNQIAAQGVIGVYAISKKDADLMNLWIRAFV